MNPLSNVKAITRMNKLELEMGLNSKSSWHNKYRDSAWIFVGGLPYELTEGDIVCVFSQYGELVNINLVRDKTTGKSKGYCFICYEDQRSTILAVDNFNGIKLLTRTLRVDHVENYRQPKEDEHIDEITKKVRSEGIAPKLSSSGSEKEGSDYDDQVKKVKKEKKARKKEGKEKKKKKRSSGDHDSEERILKPEIIKTDLKISRSKERDSRSYRNRINDMDDSHDQMKPLNYSQGNDERNERIRPRNENYYTDKVFSRKGEDNYYKNPIKERGIKRYREPSREADMNRNYNRDRNWVNTNWDRRREMNRGRDRNREYFDRKRPRW